MLRSESAGSCWRPAHALILALLLATACATSGSGDGSGMTFSAQPLQGKVVWNDLITEDAEAARRFYGGMFGWTYRDAGTRDGNPYSLAKSGNTYVAGIVSIKPQPDGRKRTRWLPYVSVPDIDASLSRTRDAGGTVAATADLAAGRIAAIVDPEGAVIGLVRSGIGDPDDRTTRAAPGRVVWTELLADDPEAAARFYAGVVGFEVETLERRGGRYIMLLGDGVQRAGILQQPDTEWDPLWLTYLGVEDAAAAATKAQSLGGKVLLAPSAQIREGTIAVVEDPSGAVLVLQKVST